MQEKKKILLKALAETVKNLRKNKSQFMLASEHDISISIISMIERGIKDPQMTTLYKLSEAFNLKFSDFIFELEKNLPKDFSLSDK